MSNPTPARGLGLLLDTVSALIPPAESWRPGSGSKLATAAVELHELGIDYLLIDDDFGPVGGPEPRLDPIVALSVISQSVPGLGLVAGVPIGSLEPYHVAKRAQTLDEASHGNGGLLVEPRRSRAAEQLIAHVTSGQTPEVAAYAAEFVHTVRQLWDSWEPDALVRDPEAGLYLDPAKVHRVDHDGRYLRVRGPSLTPRSPQGLSPIFTIATDTASVRSAFAWADVVVTDLPTEELEALTHEGLRAESLRAGGLADEQTGPLTARLVPASNVNERTLLDGVVVDARGTELSELLPTLREHPLRDARRRSRDAGHLRERLGLAPHSTLRKEHAHA
ncbi:alkanesulfonate monooxygenase SsuD/methylene tetrahydromethanopterin reductase-like flavin-dependent oxidoreductase (luciferase family) [Pseudoclavibacter sp. JAI123]|uniref:LLM class flavin-dependent oxidoreductase n=1 Tax=Pseudoclavibacter sp. JAI123 TaxID=2723065 RepID=UPI0015C765D4|nr:LLM class flavin-dependent oxidoreductase [Pseudoclavibacter sp. JAI123]NYF12642.1 alkanesulfonate monooxygenase SsuD/methylene tetrahydromethanopterin reductase-like flavin-dependent oxidoreductase (luciferase family) [Pseudoclavibacter sp. JAI123]